jgi:hypothetical protein
MDYNGDNSIQARALRLVQDARSKRIVITFSDAEAFELALQAIRVKGGKLTKIECLRSLEPSLRLAARTVFRVMARITGRNFDHLVHELNRLDGCDRNRLGWKRSPDRPSAWESPQPRGIFTISEWKRMLGK